MDGSRKHYFEGGNPDPGGQYHKYSHISGF